MLPDYDAAVAGTIMDLVDYTMERADGDQSIPGEDPSGPDRLKSDRERDGESQLETHWSIMEQSLIKLRQLQRDPSGDVELQRLLVRETLRRACWEVVLYACHDKSKMCGRIGLGAYTGMLLGDEREGSADNTSSYGRAMLMAHILDQCLSRLGLLGRLKIIIEPSPPSEQARFDEPPVIKLPLGKKVSLASAEATL